MGNIEDKPQFPYDNFLVNLTLKDKADKKHIFSNVIKTPQDNGKFIDAFDVSFKYVENQEECEINFSDILQNDFKDLYRLFNRSMSDFSTCYQEKFEKAKINEDDYTWDGVNGELLITGRVLVDEFQTCIVAEDGCEITFDIV